MEKLRFKVQEIEGPLDLILQLIQKHKLNIYDIEISALLDQYMQVMDEMRENQLDIASEFLEMASRLVYIKTAMLLPRHEDEQEDPREELTGALLEYQACREMAGMLRQRAENNDRMIRPPIRIQADMSYALTHAPELLARAYNDALGRGRRKLPPPASAFSGIVARRVVSVESRIALVLTRLYRRPCVRLEEIYELCEDRPELVATFLAVLELIRSKRARLDEDGRLAMVRRAAAFSREEEIERAF